MDDSLKTLADARQPLLDALAQTFTLYGWPDVAGRIYGLLRLEDDPLSLDEIREYLGVSKATISTHMRMLESLHVVQRVRGPQSSDGSGGRPRAYFDAERDPLKVIQKLMRHSTRRELEIMNWGIGESKSRLAELRSTIASDPGLMADAETDLEALEGFTAYMAWIQHLLWISQSVEHMQHSVSMSEDETQVLHPQLEVER